MWASHYNNFLLIHLVRCQYTWYCILQKKEIWTAVVIIINQKAQERNNLCCWYMSGSLLQFSKVTTLLEVKTHDRGGKRRTWSGKDDSRIWFLIVRLCHFGSLFRTDLWWGYFISNRFRYTLATYTCGLWSCFHCQN